MKIERRQFLHLTAAAAALPAVSRVARAQAYPSRPITIVVPFAAGGNNDANARILAEQMRGPLGQPVIIENVSGADGSIGTGRVARARPPSRFGQACRAYASGAPWQEAGEPGQSSPLYLPRMRPTNRTRGKAIR